MGERLANRILLIGWDAADWQIIQPLLDAGQMPTLQKMIEQGVMGNISTLRPILSPILWNSIATGKRADKHGIYGFVEPSPEGTGIRPVTSTSRKCKAIWNILTQQGMKSNVLNWYASHPAEPINGISVSDAFAGTHDEHGKEKVLPKESIWPAEMVEVLSALRMAPEQLTRGHVLPFIPKLDQIPPERQKMVASMLRILARCATVHTAVTEVIENHPWDFTAVYYEAIDHFGHTFMHYHPPRMAHVPEEEFEWFKGVIDGIYRFHDMMLDRLLKLAGEDCTVIITSDHGFQSDHLRPVEPLDKPTTAPESWHRPHGVFVMSGPHVLKDERIYGASILDITPTILVALGLPVGEDMDGKALVQCFDKPVQVERIKSWEEIAGDAGMHPPDKRSDPYEQQEALQQLVDLGYIEAPDKDATLAIKKIRTEMRYNLAISQYDAARYQRAAVIFEELLAEDPADVRLAVPLTQCYLATRRLEDARRVLDVVDRANTNIGAPRQFARGALEFAEGNLEAALQLLQTAERVDPRMPYLHVQIGNIYLRMRRWDLADRAFQKALTVDPDSAQATYGRGLAEFHRGNYQSSVELFLHAVGLQHFFPRAHLSLGMGLSRMGWYEQAIKALQVCITQHPNQAVAYRLMAVCHASLGQVDLAMNCRRHAQLAIEAARAARATQNAKLANEDHQSPSA